MDSLRNLAGMFSLVIGIILIGVGLFFPPTLIYGIPLLVFGILLLVDFGNESKIEKIKKRKK
tara:strand:- start:50 stop:235 length:186 start_codon:yes stop_codon:yes gene_type:complete